MEKPVLTKGRRGETTLQIWRKEMQKSLVLSSKVLPVLRHGGGKKVGSCLGLTRVIQKNFTHKEQTSYKTHKYLNHNLQQVARSEYNWEEGIGDVKNGPRKRVHTGEIYGVAWGGQTL